MSLYKTRQEILLDYWFGRCSDDRLMDRNSVRIRRWFSDNPQTNRQIRENFEPDLLAAKAGHLADWQATARGCLALIVLADQFPRRLYREIPKVFEADEMALSLCLRSLAERLDEMLQLFERLFFYMPLMHAESAEVQQKALHYFRRLAEDARKKNSPNADYFFDALDQALKHYALIERFGRFPERNQILGRESTPEEREFLKTRETVHEF